MLTTHDTQAECWGGKPTKCKVIVEVYSELWFTQLIKLVIHVARVPHIVLYTTQKHFWRKDTKITSPLFSDTPETAKDGCRKAGLPRWQRTASTPFGQVPHGPYWEPGDPSQATHGSRWDNGHIHTYRVIPPDINDPLKICQKMEI